MYQGTESLILDHVSKLGDYIHAYVVEPGRGNDYRGRVVILGRVVIQVHPVYYENGPVAIRVESASGDTLRCMRFLGENPEVVRAAIANALPIRRTAMEGE